MPFPRKPWVCVGAELGGEGAGLRRAEQSRGGPCPEGVTGWGMGGCAGQGRPEG